MDITAIVKRNAQRQSAFKAQYLKALRQSQEELNSGENVGLTEFDHNSNAQLNVNSEPLNLYEESNIGIDYKERAIELLSQIIRDNNRGDLLSGIVEDLDAQDPDFVPLLCINFASLKADILRQYSGKKIDNIYQFEQFLIAKLSELKGRQKLVDNKTDVENRIGLNRKAEESRLEEAGKSEQAFLAEQQKQREEVLKQEIKRLKDEEKAIEKYWDEYRKSLGKHPSREEMIEAERVRRELEEKKVITQGKISNLKNKKIPAIVSPIPSSVSSQPSSLTSTTVPATPASVNTSLSSLVVPTPTRNATEDEIDKLIGMLSSPALASYFYDETLKKPETFKQDIMDNKNDISPIFWVSSAIEQQAKLNFDSDAINEISVVEQELNKLMDEGVKVLPMSVGKAINSSATMPSAINVSSGNSKSATPFATPIATPVGSRPSSPITNNASLSNFSSSLNPSTQSTYDGVSLILNKNWVDSKIVNVLKTFSEKLGLDDKTVKAPSLKKEYYDYIRLKIATTIDSGDVAEVDKLLDESKVWISQKKIDELKALVTTKSGHGLFPRKARIGNPKLTIDTVKLGKGLLDVRYAKSRISHPKLPQQFISPQQKSIIKGMLDGRFSHTDYNKLDDHEKALINQIIKHFNLDIDTSDNESLQCRWEIVKAELKAGNNSDHLKQEAKKFLLSFHNMGIISSSEMMRLLASLGIH